MTAPDTTNPLVQSIIVISRTDVQPYANNPRRITEQNVADMAALISHHGFRIPVLVRAGDGVWNLVDGHLRLRAAELLGMEVLPAIDVSDMDDAQIAAFRLSVNKAAELADWDSDLLSHELAMLNDTDPLLLAMSGFTDSDMSGFSAPEPIAQPTPQPQNIGGQNVNQTADRRRVRNENDPVNLTLGMTVSQRITVLARLDTIMQERGLSSRSEALIACLTPAAVPAEETAPKTRRRGK